ncbi:MAG: PIN domain-containing protein [Patescibacteria group bacterium]
MKKIALDSMVFIYHFEQTPAFCGRVREILLAAREGESKLITSVISVVEALVAPKYSQLPEVVRGIKQFFEEAEFLEVIDLGEQIAFEAARLRRENKSLRTPDAIQLATAIIGGADVFITNDRKLRNLKFGSMKVQMI